MASSTDPRDAESDEGVVTPDRTLFHAYCVGGSYLSTSSASALSLPKGSQEHLYPGIVGGAASRVDRSKGVLLTKGLADCGSEVTGLAKTG